MIATDLRCPEGLWPKGFTATVALGVFDIRGIGTGTLWFVFEVDNGLNTQTWACVANGRDIPDEVHAYGPKIITSATRAIWSLVRSDWTAFGGKVADGELHISGEYRTFGRYTPSLIETLRNADLWDRIEGVLNQVR